ncbi:hypothetical protein KL938_005306 [Ogataea parapolymorpha]|nr:hypothetical protein KL938_005306 [Ogataea parapolymorpha]
MPSLIWFLIPLVSCAGVAVHMNILSRVYSDLPGDIRGLTGSLLAGAFHPDSFYDCMGHSNAGEEAHWPPFLRELVLTYKQMAEPDKKLKAFIYGVFTHQIADINWHSLHKSQGLLQYLAHIEFNGNVSQAHSFLDTGADFLVLSHQFENLGLNQRISLREYYSTPWDFPTKELVETYRKLGFEVTESEIEFCMMRGYAALQGELGTFRSFAPAVRYKSPLLNEVLDDYYFGGLSDIIYTISCCMKGLAGLFDGTMVNDPWLICPIFQPNHNDASTSSNYAIRSNDQQISMTRKSDGALHLWSDSVNSKFGTSLLFHVSAYGYAELLIGAEYDEGQGSVYVLPLKHLFEGQVHVMSTKLYEETNELTFAPRFGHGMAIWNTSRHSFLVISEPGLSQLNVFLDSRLVAVIHDEKARTQLGSGGPKQMGLILAVNDVNDDGINDLIVGSCHYDTLDAIQRGIVKILSGAHFAKLIEEYIDSALGIHGFPLHINDEQIEINCLTIPRQLQRDSGYDEFATSIAFSPDKLFIGSAGSGTLATFNKSGEFLYGMIPDSHVRVTQNTPFESTGLYGYHKIITGSWNKIAWVMVFANSETVDNCLLCGVAYLYLDRQRLELVAKVRPEKGQQLFFGVNALARGNDVYVAAEGSLDGAGAIWKINVGKILEANANMKFKQDILLCEEKTGFGGIIIHGTIGEGYSGFGRSLEVFEFQQALYIAVGRPLYGYGSASGLTGAVDIHKLDD